MGPSSAYVGKEVHFSALRGLKNYSWVAWDANGNSVGGFNDSTKADVTWTPSVPGNFTISFNNLMCTQLVSVRKSNPGVQIKKNCNYKAPVYVGDTITYIYNITNTGDVPLKDVNVTDIQDWGPDCHPVYVKGDNGNGILDPGETWRYECNYTVPDPSDYQQQLLHTMSDDSSEEAIIQKLTDMKAPLEMKMGSLESKRRQFIQ